MASRLYQRYSRGFDSVMFLVRKISLAKWCSQNGLAEYEISADAVTADLRTQGNCLSFWKCEGTDTEISEVAMAIAAAGNRVDKLDLVWISNEQLKAEGQYWLDTRGRTPVIHMANKHVDVCRLDYVRLGRIAHSIAKAIKEGRYKRLPKRSVLRLLVSAVRQEIVDIPRLKGKVIR